MKKLVPLALVAVLAVGAGLRFVDLGRDPPLHFSWSLGIFSDGPNYVSDARNKALFGDWHPGDRPSYFSGIVLFPVQTSLTYLGYEIFGVGRAQAAIVPALAGVLLCLLMFFLMGRGWPGLMASFLTAVCTVLVVYNRTPLAESLALVLAALTLYLWSMRNRARRFAVLSGIALGLVVLAVKPHTVFLAGVIALSAYFQRRQRGLRYLLDALLGFAAIAVPWFLLFFLRNPEIFTNYLGSGVRAETIAAQGIRGFLENFLGVGIYSRLFVRMPFLSLLGYLGFCLSVLSLRAKRSLRPEAEVLSLWFLLGFVFLGLFAKYSPLRFHLLLVPPLIGLSVLLSTGRLPPRGKRPLLRRPFDPLLAVLLFPFLYQLIMAIVRKPVELAVVIGAAILSALLCMWVPRFKSTARGTVARPILMTILLLGSFLFNGILLVGISTSPRRTMETASVDLSAVLGEHALLSGSMAGALTLDNSVPCYASVVSFLTPENIASLGITHLIANTNEVRKSLPEWEDSLHTIRTYLVGPSYYSLYQVPRQPEFYSPSVIERAILAMNRGNHAEARSLFHEALRAHPEAPTSYFGLSLLYKGIGRLDSALVYAERGWNLDRKDVRLAEHRLHLYSLTGNQRMQRKAYQELLEVNPFLARLKEIEETGWTAPHPDNRRWDFYR
jgi:hypothetical protein